MITFRLNIVPPKATSQSAGKRMVIVKGRPMFFKSAKAKSAEQDLTSLCAPHAPTEPLRNPLALEVGFTFPWRASEPQWRKKLSDVPHDKRPDCDNLVKMLGDVLTKLQFYRDDAQVALLSVTKAWGDSPGIDVTIRELPVATRSD